MDMEGIGTEELVGSCNNDATHVAKGKRTKRLRPLSPCAVAATVMTASSCSSASGEHASGGGDYVSFSSTTTTTFEGADHQEEEDMANCLILLAQGGGGGDAHQKQQEAERGSSSSSSRRFAEMATANIGFYIYECKTCNRTFPSFQALGGHRASHKKPKVTPEERKPAAPSALTPPLPPLTTHYDEFEEAKQPHIKSINPPISLQLGCGNRAFHGNKSKIHECSVCGSEFTSGQALGGHMRRHRASTNTASAQVVGMNTMSGMETSCDPAVEVKPRKVLELDLNLPAPEEDLRDSKFQFTATQKPMVLSAAPALVGCHY